MKSQDPIPIGTLLLSPAIAAIDRVNAVLAESGFDDIRPAQARALRYIGVEGARITEMAEGAHMTKQSMSTLVGYLVERGYLAFESDPEDRRAKRVVLTERGQAVKALGVRTMTELETAWAEVLGRQEMARLRELLERLYESVGNEGLNDDTA